MSAVKICLSDGELVDKGELVYAVSYYGNRGIEISPVIVLSQNLRYYDIYDKYNCIGGGLRSETRLHATLESAFSYANTVRVRLIVIKHPEFQAIEPWAL